MQRWGGTGCPSELALLQPLFLAYASPDQHVQWIRVAVTFLCEVKTWHI